MGDNKEIPRIDFAHERLHEGESFMAYNDELTMATTETINFAFKTPAATLGKIHMVVEYETLIGLFCCAAWCAAHGTGCFHR